jgi:uncharacterized protein
MPRKYLRYVLPGAERIRKIRGVTWLASWLGDPYLWHINRRAVALGVAVGLFVAFLPVPMQTPLAMLGALILRANLPISVVFVWVSNPVTYLPLFGMAYLFGAYLTGADASAISDFSLQNMGKDFGVLWLGCLTLGCVAALAGWSVVRGYWYWHVHSSWHLRRRSRKKPGSTTL